MVLHPTTEQKVLGSNPLHSWAGLLVEVADTDGCEADAPGEIVDRPRNPTIAGLF